MKTLYININNEQIQSNDELEVLNYDLDSDFFFYLGEKIAKGCKVENENALITDFNTQDNAGDYQKIIAQWNEIKTSLFSEKCEGEFKFTLPGGYIHWLKFHPQYVAIYHKNFSHGEPTVISIDLEELYEESVEDMQRKVLRTLKRNDLYLEIDEIVFNDDALIPSTSMIINSIRKVYTSILILSLNEWKERLEKKRFENEKLERERLLREQQEREQQERLEQERLEQERLVNERLNKKCIEKTQYCRPEKYRWETDAFRVIVEADKKRLEDIRQEKEKERQEKERQEMIEKYREKWHKKEEKKRRN